MDLNVGFIFVEQVFQVWKKLRYTYLTLDKRVVELLSVLRKHYMIGLISNGTSRAQWEKILHIRATELFDSILVSGDLTCEKPDPKIFHLACQQLSVLPERS